MDISDLKRDAKYVLSALKEMPDGSVVTTKPCKIQIPVRFSERNMASIGAEIYIPGIYALIIDDKYAVSTINAQILINPVKIIKVNIQDDEYFEFYFDANEKLFNSTNLVKKDTLVYYIFDELMSKCNIPWYLKYDDLGKLLDTASYHAGTNIADNNELTELIISIISRDAIDKTKYYRATIKDNEYVISHPPAYISLNNVIFSATNTLNKLAGSYIDDGIISALVDKSVRVERIEELLRA